MPLEYAQPDDLRPMVERRQAGHDLRRLVPRGQHAGWQPPADRREPLQGRLRLDPLGGAVDAQHLHGLDDRNEHGL